MKKKLLYTTLFSTVLLIASHQTIAQAEKAEAAIELELDKVRKDLLDDRELQKVKNKTESVMAFEDMSVMNRAGSLAFYELLGDGELMNTEFQKYQEVKSEDLHRIANEVLKNEKGEEVLSSTEVEPYSVRYDKIGVYLIQIVADQQRELEQLKARLELLESK